MRYVVTTQNVVYSAFNEDFLEQAKAEGPALAKAVRADVRITDITALHTHPHHGVIAVYTYKEGG